MELVKFGFTAEQIIKEGRLTRQDIDELKEWLATRSFPKITEEQIVIFILSCLNDQELTKNTIKAYYSVRKDAPELFNNRKMDRTDIQKQLQTVEFNILPERTDDGCAIILHRLYDTNFSNYDMGPSMKLMFMTLDAAIYDHPPTGLVILFDMKGVGLMHLTKIRIGLIRNFFFYLQEALPLRLKVIHVLNAAYFIDKVMNIIKPFIKKEVMDLLHFHSPSMDMNCFYENYLPRKCLPEDFGGELPSIRELHQRNIGKLTEIETHFEAEEYQRNNC